MNRDSIDELFRSISFRGRTIPSRLLLAPINTGFSRNSRPSLRLLQFHERRSGPEIGISILGNVAVSRTSVSNEGTIILESRSDVARLALIARRIKERGSLAGIQLSFAPATLSPTPIWRAKDYGAEVRRLQQLILRLDATEITTFLRQIQNSANLAANAGFEFVQVHAAHGYLLSLLLNKHTNFRIDEYSANGPWLKFLFNGLRNATDALLGIRISVLSGIGPEDMELSLTQQLVGRLVSTGFDVISLSGGMYTLDRRMIYPAAPDHLPYLQAAAAMAIQHPDCLFGVAGGVVDLRAVPDGTPTNLLYEIGRALIADPEYAAKFKGNRIEQVQWCARTNRCHYFSRGRSQIECGTNRMLGRSMNAH